MRLPSLHANRSPHSHLSQSTFLLFFYYSIFYLFQSRFLTVFCFPLSMFAVFLSTVLSLFHPLPPSPDCLLFSSLFVHSPLHPHLSLSAVLFFLCSISFTFDSDCLLFPSFKTRRPSLLSSVLGSLSLRRWARSTLVLVPLFGVHYAMLLGFTYFMGKNSTIELMWLFTDQFFASFQVSNVWFCVLLSDSFFSFSLIFFFFS